MRRRSHRSPCSNDYKKSSPTRASPRDDTLSNSSSPVRFSSMAKSSANWEPKPTLPSTRLKPPAASSTIAQARVSHSAQASRSCFLACRSSGPQNSAQFSSWLSGARVSGRQSGLFREWFNLSHQRRRAYRYHVEILVQYSADLSHQDQG